MISAEQIMPLIGDQLRAFLVNMLPKEAVDQVINTAWRKLTEPRPELDYNGRPKQGKMLPSELESMITDMMREQLKTLVATWASEWAKTPDCEVAAKGMLSELIEQAAGGFMRRVAASIVVEAATTLSGTGSVVACGCGRVSLRGGTCFCGQQTY